MLHKLKKYTQYMLQVQSLMNTYENHLVVDVQSYQRCFSRQSYCND